MEQRRCLDCGEAIFGRADKKFCSDQCRNNYNNRQHAGETAFIRTVNAILRKNRSILSKLNPDGKVTVHKDKLVSKGFNFNYYTHLYTTQKGATYYFVYEQGYLPLENNFYALVKRENRQNIEQ